MSAQIRLTSSDFCFCWGKKARYVSEKECSRRDAVVGNALSSPCTSWDKEPWSKVSFLLKCKCLETILPTPSIYEFFIRLHWVLVVACGNLHCGTGTLWLGCTVSVVVMHRLSCPTACGILVPWQGIKPASLTLQGGFLTTEPARKSPEEYIWNCFYKHQADFYMKKKIGGNGCEDIARLWVRNNSLDKIGSWD